MWRMRIKGVLVGLLALALIGGCGGKAPATVAQQRSSAPSVTEASPSAPAPASPSAPASGAPSPSPVVVPAGVTAGIAVFDRKTGTFLSQVHPTTQFRSASLVKLFIALDYLWNRGPTYAVPAADRPRLEVMLRSSDDNAATSFWKADGSEQIVTRMISRLHLQNTAPPPAERRGWGFTAVTAGDLVRVYRYLLDEAPAPVREFVMSNLHASTKCGTDAFDQSFGIPTAFQGRPWAAKQGWSGFGDTPATPCKPRPSAVAASTTERFTAVPASIMGGVVLHTTGTVGAGDRFIVAVLTHTPSGASFARATSTLTQLVRSLPVPAN
jgi:hypothetical protein